MTSNAENREKCAEALADVPAEDKAKMAELVAGADGARMATEDPKPRKKPRDAIDAFRLINRLQQDIDGSPNNPPLSSSQIRAIEILLKKALPDLQAIQISGDDEADPVRTISRIELVDLVSSPSRTTSET